MKDNVVVLPHPDARIRALEEWIEGIKGGTVFDVIVIGHRVGGEGPSFTPGWRLTGPEWSSTLIKVAEFLEGTWSPDNRFPLYKSSEETKPDGPEETT